MEIQVGNHDHVDDNKYLDYNLHDSPPVSDFSHVVYSSVRGESLFTYNNILSMSDIRLIHTINMVLNTDKETDDYLTVHHLE